MNGYGNPYLEPLLMREMRERLNPPTTRELVSRDLDVRSRTGGGRDLDWLQDEDPRHDPYALALPPRRPARYEDPRDYVSPIREILPPQTEQWYDDPPDWKNNLSERERRGLRGY